MNTVEIPEKELRFYVPEHLGECDEGQYTSTCRLLFEYQSGKMSLEQFKVRAIYLLLRLKETKRKLTQSEEEDMQANIYQLSGLVDSFFTKTKDEKIQIRQEYQHNPVPIIETAWGNYHGPDDYLRSVTFGEYIQGLNIFSMFNETGKVRLLYDFAAVFYRGKEKAFNPEKIEKISKQLKHADFGKIYGFYLFFASFQHYLGNAIVQWEGRQLDLSILFKKTSKDNFKSSIPGLGMKATSYMLAETGVLGNLEEVNKANIWEVLLLMYDIKKNDMDNTKRMDQQKKD